MKAMKIFQPCVSRRPDAVPVTIYHTGYLARDRQHDAGLNKKANALWKKAMQKKIHLLQRRAGALKWHYFYVEAGRNEK